MYNKALFLDRDGVVNKARTIGGKSYPPRKIEDFQLLPGVKDALELSKKMGFLNIIITNQPDISNGRTSVEFVEACHKKLLKMVPIDDIYICSHVEEDKCSCRKPKPGMIIAAQKKWDINLEESFLVGDRWKDIEAGQVMKCCCFFINYKYNEPQPKSPYFKVSSLGEAVNKIYTRERK